MRESSSTPSVFRNRSFTLLWTAQLVSALGSALTALAASVLVFRVTDSALSVGVILIATSGPTILVGLIAGVFVDRYDRKRIMLASDLLRAILVALLPFLIQLSIAWLYIIVALISSITQFFNSAHASVLPEVATDKQLAAATSWVAVASLASTTVGFVAGGLIATSLRLDWAFYLNGLSFLASAGLILVMRLPAVPATADTSLRAIGRNFGAGFQLVRSTPILRSLFVGISPIYLLFGLQISLVLPFTLRALGGTELHFGMQQATEAIGIAVGCSVMARLADRIRAGQWLAISYLGMAAVTIIYSFSRSAWLVILLMGVSGLFESPSFIGEQLVVQRASPREMRGRVNSAYFVVRDLMHVAGMALAGLADLMNVRTLYAISAFAQAIAGGVVLSLPALRETFTEWKRTLTLLRGVEAAPRLGAGRAASRCDIDRLVQQVHGLERMTSGERDELAAQTMVAQAPGGKLVVYRGETSDMAYFILKGSVGVGYIKDAEYVILDILKEGDYFGEVAALTGSARTANVITEDECEFLVLPARILRDLVGQYTDVGATFQATMTKRLSTLGASRQASLDQHMLRELRTNVPATRSA